MLERTCMDFSILMDEFGDASGRRVSASTHSSIIDGQYE